MNSADPTSDKSERLDSAIDRSFETIEFAISFEEYMRLPQNGNYSYEYLCGRAVISPNPYTRHARLATDTVLALDDPLDILRDFSVRPLCDSDQEQLGSAFAVAFAHQPPFGTLGNERRKAAASEAIGETFAGRHGSLVWTASHVITNAEGNLFGAGLVTITHDREATREARPCKPHLTWLFVNPVLRRHGLATHLLAHALRALRNDGWSFLYTTFLVGSHASAMWHWETGFELLPNEFSLRRRSRARQRSNPGGHGKVTHAT